MPWKIGELATHTATPVDTIRYYEREGLLPAPARSAGNYRMYDDAHAERLRFIRQCRGLDLSLDEVRALLRVKDAPADDCGDANRVLDTHIGHVAARIRELRALERQLKALRARCGASRPAAECGILTGLTEGDAAAPANAERPAQVAAATNGPRPTAHLGGVHGRRGTGGPPARS